ncbi:hypothetical protein [Acetobacter aceti]|uniref:hypothetical protein n=1 Tax=Acetobacter aceti TaxID=435 RepID=UPI0011EA55E2|nr:hypothetical protein [Acetobacter aceti]
MMHAPVDHRRDPCGRDICPRGGLGDIGIERRGPASVVRSRRGGMEAGRWIMMMSFSWRRPTGTARHRKAVRKWHCRDGRF